jgi:RPA family protein
MATKQNFRAEARIVPLSFLHSGTYIVGNETSTSYLKLIDQTELIRINSVAAVVKREDLGAITIFTIDDGSDNISVRFFEPRKILDNIAVGNVVLIIGRIREYNSERYIAAEIIRSVSSRWLKYRSLILHSKKQEIEESSIEKQKVNTLSYSNSNQIDSTAVNSKSFEKIKKTIDLEDKKIEEKKVIENVPTLTSPEAATYINPYLELMTLISKLDSGNGVALEEIIRESQFSNTEEILQKMMENGDIFQNLPGKVKVL